MKKNILFVLLAFMVLIACKKDKQLVYSSADNIYFDYKRSDSLIYTFAYTPAVALDTIFLPVKISGIRVNHDRKFFLNVVDSASTAVSNLHYIALKPSYVLPADSGTIHVPVILKNTDVALATKSVSLTIRVSGGTDFSSMLPDSMRVKKIFFSNRLEKPIWWEDWDQLGTYTRVKHKLFLISSGTRDLIVVTGNPLAYQDIPRDLFYISNMRAFLADPFDWVKQNTAKGYVLTLASDGSGDYDFYNVNAPTQKIKLKYYKNGSYIFIDENGGQVLV